MSISPRLPMLKTVFLFCAVIAASSGVLADDDRRMSRTPLLELYKQECSACHVAYPPQLLPAASWKHLMDTLPRHFGTDASLEPAAVNQLWTWFNANAGGGKTGNARPPEDRITRSAWFVREHDEISAATWKRPAIKSASNCMACHSAADKGDFSEHNIHIPR